MRGEGAVCLPDISLGSAVGSERLEGEIGLAQRVGLLARPSESGLADVNRIGVLK